MRRFPLEASQATIEAAADLEQWVTPGRQQFHPSACKAWATWNSAAAIQASYNVASITDNAAGNWSMVIATDMSGAEYVHAAMGGRNGSHMLIYSHHVGSDATTCYVIAVRRATTTLDDPSSPDRIYCAAFGDQ